MKGGKTHADGKKSAIKVLRKKLVGKDKANYSLLSMADKKQIDLKVKKNQARIALARKLLPQVRKRCYAES